MDRSRWKLVRAGDIPDGTCFVKRTGTFAYLRVSASSVRHMGLNQGLVYGVCYNGNMTCLAEGRMVWSVPLEQMEVNREAERRWERGVGVTESSPYLLLYDD